MTSETKDCPFCAESIKAAAKKCKHCGEFLEGSTRDSIRREIGFDQEGQTVEGHQANIGDMKGDIGQIGDNISVGKELRDEQYEIALNWEANGRPRMRGFDLSERNLSGLTLTGTDLSWANLSRAELRRAYLNGAYLDRANLRDADLIGTDLHRSNLNKANLRGAELRRANMLMADMRDADMRDADMRDAFLFGADLRLADLSGAKYTNNTKWPKDFDLITAGAILVDDEGNPIEDQDEEE